MNLTPSTHHRTAPRTPRQESEPQDIPELDLATPRVNTDRTAIERADRVAMAASEMAIDFTARIHDANSAGLSEVSLGTFAKLPADESQREEAMALTSALSKLSGLLNGRHLKFEMRTPSVTSFEVQGKQELVASW